MLDKSIFWCKKVWMLPDLSLIQKWTIGINNCLKWHFASVYQRYQWGKRKTCIVCHYRHHDKRNQGEEVIYSEFFLNFGFLISASYSQRCATWRFNPIHFYKPILQSYLDFSFIFGGLIPDGILDWQSEEIEVTCNPRLKLQRTTAQSDRRSLRSNATWLRGSLIALGAL